ncbi:hypothetical protein GUITHDRAFT_122740 [Guillardia theta CCMP2712]|uniref:C2 domain-containing protein n=1 Tax=Guillardia theta (strain CCMP2712) TaxID=905079 RepID=L1I464_GUITC|nr:hypothetical protein GUITHDRAFT_122740 [Guillardia theta CCMP2712]EKX31058.1 hypothetical protein GUITHDRAFT_122740 [Guillardia theta CCMP2712]|eukprot:XP_005818038.1 hypothetical protein GUITHDRAFT_122740 [Guillardia theta CCMP2712]
MDFHILDYHKEKVSGLLIKVMDWNKLSGSEFIGARYIDLTPYVGKQQGLVELSESIVNHLSGVQGEVVLGHNKEEVVMEGKKKRRGRGRGNDGESGRGRGGRREVSQRQEKQEHKKQRWETKGLLGSSSMELEEVTHVVVKALEFENVPKMDLMGSCDPLLEICCGETTYHTETAWGSTRGHGMKSMDLTLMLYDDNRGKFKDLIGRASIRMNSVLQADEIWVEMKKKNGESVLGQNKKTTRVKIRVMAWKYDNMVDKYVESKFPLVNSVSSCFVEASLFIKEEKSNEKARSSVRDVYNGFPIWSEEIKLHIPKNEDIFDMSIRFILMAPKSNLFANSTVLGRADLTDTFVPASAHGRRSDKTATACLLSACTTCEHMTSPCKMTQKLEERLEQLQKASLKFHTEQQEIEEHNRERHNQMNLIRTQFHKLQAELNENQGDEQVRAKERVMMDDIQKQINTFPGTFNIEQKKELLIVITITILNLFIYMLFV